MKRIYTILVAVLLAASVFAQAPEKMTYQAVVRDDNSTLITSTQVGIEINIYQGSATGTLVYTETQTPTTNINGLITIEIGGETGFDLIDWANGPYFIETKIDPDNSGTYTITGTSQLLTVPYALHAKTAESIIGGINETDPVFLGSQANNITATDITNLSNLSGTNTGDQDISGIAINEQAIQDTASQIRADFPDVSGFITTEVDPIFTNSEANNITATDITNLSNLSGTNTGDQTISRSGLTVTLTNGGTYQDSVNVYTAGDGIDISGTIISEHKYQIGDFAQGGIIFWLDETGEHGLVCSISDQGGSGYRWYAGTDGLTRAQGNGSYAGEANTSLIIAALLVIGDDGNPYAAYTCSVYDTTVDGKTYGDWYLPALDELDQMYLNKTIIDATATANGGTAFTNDVYWSSQDYIANAAWGKSIDDGSVHNYLKSSIRRVRAIRAF